MLGLVLQREIQEFEYSADHRDHKMATKDHTINSNVPTCPCGKGKLKVLLSNTSLNPGRQFLTCPDSHMGEKGCGFFVWCDQLLMCRCGKAPCRLLMAKTEKNKGRAFYTCPFQDDRNCKFFCWLDNVASIEGGDQQGKTCCGSTSGKERNESSSTEKNSSQELHHVWKIERELILEERDHARRMSDLYRELIHGLEEININDE